MPAVEARSCGSDLLRAPAAIAVAEDVGLPAAIGVLGDQITGPGAKGAANRGTANAMGGQTTDRGAHAAANRCSGGLARRTAGDTERKQPGKGNSGNALHAFLHCQSRSGRLRPDRDSFYPII